MTIKSLAKKKSTKLYTKKLYHKDKNDAFLILEDGSVIFGEGFGYPSYKVGEVCFNTSMTGYQEILTDPSYKSQIVTFTFPHIGITGTNKLDKESKLSYVSGLIIREKIYPSSNWRSQKGFEKWVKKMHLPGISGIDTRALTKKIILQKAPKGIICYDPENKFNINDLKEILKKWKGIKNLDLVPSVSTRKTYFWNKGIYNLKKISPKNLKNNHLSYNVLVIDYGIKQNILRSLYSLNCKITVLSSNESYEKIISHHPDGIILSNGPGDPKATANNCSRTLSKLVNSNIPIFGICIGHQLLALTLGAKTKKMSQGHRGGNHPVINLNNGLVEITSQNHGFTVLDKNLPKNVSITHRSLFDGSIEGIAHKSKRIFSVQYHPEASPGPHDSKYLFEQFCDLMEKYKKEIKHAKK